MDYLERALLLDLFLRRDDYPPDKSGRVVNVFVLKSEDTLYLLEREIQRLALVTKDLEETDGHHVVEILGCQEIISSVPLTHVKYL